MTTLVHGLIAGGTVSYLYQTTNKKAEDLSPQTWDQVALQANHLLLLVGTVLSQANLEFGPFSLAAKGMLLLTPIVILGGILTKGNGICQSESVLATKFSRCYLVASIASSMALLLLGNTAFGVASLALIALSIAEKEGKFSPNLVTALKYTTTTTAALGAFSYGLWILTTGTAISQAALATTLLLSAVSSIQKTIGQSSASQNNPPAPGLPPAPQSQNGPPGGPSHPKSGSTNAPFPAPLILPTPSAPSLDSKAPDPTSSSATMALPSAPPVPSSHPVFSAARWRQKPTGGITATSSFQQPQIQRPFGMPHTFRPAAPPSQPRPATETSSSWGSSFRSVAAFLGPKPSFH